MTFPEALAKIDTTDHTTIQKFVISLTEDIDICQYGTYSESFALHYHETTILGNGHSITTNRFIKSTHQVFNELTNNYENNGTSVIHFGNPDGTDTLTIIGEEYINEGLIAAANEGIIHMYNGVTLTQLDSDPDRIQGKAAYADLSGTFYMHGGVVENINATPSAPGAISIAKNGTFVMTGGTIRNCKTLDGNGYGGAIFADGGTVTIDGRNSSIEISNNYAEKNGGAIRAYNGAVVKIIGDVHFNNNKAGGNGGAINTNGSCVLEIDGATFSGNEAIGAYGGAIYSQRLSSGVNHVLKIENTTFQDNTAAYGGAVLLLGGLGNSNEMCAEFSECEFLNNKALVYQDASGASDGGLGGAIYIQDVKLDLTNCLIEENKAEAFAGGLYFNGNEPNLMALNISGATKIYDNSAPVADNLYLLSISLSTGQGTSVYQSILNVVGSLEQGNNKTSIGIYMDNPGVFTSGYTQNCGGTDPKKYFMSDDPQNYHVQFNADNTEAMLAQGAVTHEIVAIKGENGSISPSGTVNVVEGGSQKFTITAESGFVIKDVLIDGVSIGATNEYVFNSVTEPHTIEVIFAKQSGTTQLHTLYYETNGGEKIASESNNGTWAKTFDTLPIPKREGYDFAGWYFDKELTRLIKESFSVDMVNITIYAKWSKAISSPTESGTDELLDTENHYAYVNGYEDGSFAPNKSMTRAETAAVFYNLLLNKNVVYENYFSDVAADAWYADAVNTLAQLDIIQGFGEKTFAPEQSITRAEFTAIAMRFGQFETNGENIFSDVAAEDWYYAPVVGSVKYGWISGYEDGTFRPNAFITRAEAVSIINRMLGREADEQYIAANQHSLRQFFDVPEKYWAYYEIMEAANSHEYTILKNQEIWSREK